MYLDTQIHAFPLVIVLGVGLLDQNCFPKWLYHVTLSPAVCDSSHWLGPLSLGPSWAAIKTGAMVSGLIYFLDTAVVLLILEISIGIEEYHIVVYIFIFLITSEAGQLSISVLII